MPLSASRSVGGDSFVCGQENMAKNPTTKPTKRRPTKEDPLVSAEQRRATRDRLQNVRKAKAAFDKAHASGIKALKEGDYDALGEAIDEERAIIEQQGKNIESTKTPRKPSK